MKKEFKDAIMDQIMYVIDRHNNGMLSTYQPNPRNIFFLHRNNIEVNLDKCIVYKDGKPFCKIERRYSARKVCLQYKELKPKLIDIE